MTTGRSGVERIDHSSSRLELKPTNQEKMGRKLIILTAERKEWENLVETGFSILIGDVISRDLYEEAKRIVAEFREK